MKKMFEERKRLFSLFLCLVMLTGMLPMNTLASETTQTVTGEGTPESPKVTITQNTSTDSAGNTVESTSTVTQSKTESEQSAQTTEKMTTEDKLEFTPAGGTDSVVLSQSKEDTTSVTTQGKEEGTDNTVTKTTTVTYITAKDKISGTRDYEMTEESEDTVIQNEKGETLKTYGYTEGTETWTRDSEQDLDVELDVSRRIDQDARGEAITVTDGKTEGLVTGDRKQGEDDPEYDQTTISQTDRTLTGTYVGTEVTMGSDVTIKEGSLSPIKADADQLGKDGKINYAGETKDPLYDYHVEGVEYHHEKPKKEGYDYYWAWEFGGSYYRIFDSLATDDPATDHDDRYSSVYEFALGYDPTGATLDYTREDIEQNKEAYIQELYAAYCVDHTTGAVRGDWYRRDNLEDAGYFTEEEAEHIRAIATHGYWGTAPTADDKTPAGSLDAVKKELKDAIAQGNELLSGLTAADIDNLTGGEAMAATQMAIWMYGNREEAVDLSAACSGDSAKRINQMAAYLASLKESAGDSTDILSEKNFVKDMSLSVGEKAADHINNYDDDQSNDAYNTNISFALAVTVDPKNDDLVVSVIGADRKVLKTVRIAGENQDGEDTQFLNANDDGSYTIENVVLVEGENSFNLELTGAQYLKRGVYIYSADPENETSQTMVGLAEGYQSVNMNMEVQFTFDVKEGEQTGVRIWRQAYYSDPKVDSDEDAEEFNEQKKYRQYDGDNPKTGDQSQIQLWMGMMAGSSLALAALLLSMKKNRAV